MRTTLMWPAQLLRHWGAWSSAHSEPLAAPFLLLQCGTWLPFRSSFCLLPDIPDSSIHIESCPQVPLWVTPASCLSSARSHRSMDLVQIFWVRFLWIHSGFYLQSFLLLSPLCLWDGLRSSLRSLCPMALLQHQSWRLRCCYLVSSCTEPPVDRV